MKLLRRLDPARRTSATLAIVVATLIVAACTPSPTPGPSAPIAPSTAPAPSAGIGSPPSSVPPTATTITTPEAAAALVLGSDPRFAGLKAQDPNLVGQCCFYLAVPAADAFTVTVEIGWGDCPAGCINRHHWFYAVAADGTIRLDREDGPPVPAGIPGPGDGGGGVVGIRGIATAGPVCPVAKPNDPACADRPVAGALVHVLDATGTEVATLETDATGAFVVTLPPGRYRVVADPVEGLMGTAAPADATVGSALAIVQLQYDTGIR